MRLVNNPSGVHWTIWMVGIVILVAPIAAPRDAELYKYAVWTVLLSVAAVGLVVERRKKITLSPFGAALMCCVLAAVLQLVPFGGEWLSQLSPYAAKLYEATGQSSDTNPISLDAVATLGFMHTGVFLLIIYCWRVTTINSRQGLRVLEYAIIGSGLIQALYGVLSVLSGADLGAFLELKQSYQNSATGTFVNRSIYGLYLNVAVVACLRIMFFSPYRPSFYSLLTIRLAMVVLVIGITMSHSRAVGLGFLAVMLVAAVALMLGKKENSKRSVAKLLFVLLTVVLVDLLVVSKWYGLEKLADRAAKTSIQSEQRDDVVHTLIGEYRLTAAPLGLGAGAFDAIYPHMERQYNVGRFVRAHSDLVELYVSLGLLALPVLILGLWAAVTNGVQGILLAVAISPHLLLDFAASHWLIWISIVLLWPARAEHIGHHVSSYNAPKNIGV